ncbi:OsmC family protein [Oleisolibacter albus]|uniref:OsmC family protein n=1 Tax=Oleisolibacter albus TaxID=2171757 RepID=UPI000DF26A25|nr:OsmC family protein [Oleisolibacter albus]
MPTRIAQAEWTGGLPDGSGRISVESQAFDTPYSFPSRFESGQGTNPEELLGASHAGCFSMALAAALGKAGFKPEQVRTTARVHLDKQDAGWGVSRIDLDTSARVPGIDQDRFQEIAAEAKRTCPISRALQAVEIGLDARLED